MKKFSKITCAILLCALVLTTLLIPMQAFAEDYIYNWGTRGEVATSLSDKAKAFYTGSYTFANLSNVSGGTSQSNAPSSALYTQLKALMTSKHSYQNSYSANNDLLKYTDCQNGGGKISSFYSGKEIGPNWGEGSWNKEHTWPNSKGLGGKDEDDIMMIRPTATSENTSRGNKAYGKSSGYYDPNSESNGKYNLRGDCARIFLYVYTRWGNTNGNGEYATWGSRGVMESLEVLLEWMEEDPVDTWEMGRNDAVEKITGTRNAFVDYPEYAFLLFGKAVPANYSTPSQSNGVTPPKPEPHTCDYTPATCTTPATCKICYQTTGSALDHTAPNAEGLCTRCNEVLEIFAPDSLEVGKAYYMSVLQGNLDNKILYFNGTTREADNYPWYFKTSEDKASAVQVFVEEAQGGYKLYFMNGTTKTYIRLYERQSGKASLSLVTTAPAEVYTYDATHKTLILTVGSNKYYIGTYDAYDTLSGSNISYISTSFPCRFIPVEGGGTVTPPAHTCQSKCSTCGGCTDASCTESACLTKCQGHQTTPPVGGDTMEITFQSSSSTQLNSSGDVKFTSSRVPHGWDADRSLQFLKADGNVTITSTSSVNNVTSIAIVMSENKGITIAVTVKVGNTVLTNNGQNSATVGKCTNETVTFTTSSAVSGVITIEFVPSQPDVSKPGSIYLAGLTITTGGGSQGGGTVTPPAHTCANKCPTCGGCTDSSCTESACLTKCQGHQTTPPEVTPDATVNAFKSAVANIQSATTLEQKFDAIITAVSVYNTMDASQKAQVTAEFATLKTAVEDYNANVALQNANSNGALGLALQVVSITVALAAALVLLKKVF